MINLKKQLIFLSKKKNEVEIYPVKLDLEDENSIKNAYKEIEKNSPTIDNLINNAGIIENGIFQMTSGKNLKKILRLILLILFYLLKKL